MISSERTVVRSSAFHGVFAFALAIGCVCAQDRAAVQAIDLDEPAPLDRVVRVLATKRVVFVGETHDRYDHHLNQLEIIRRLHELDPKLAIGIEYFPQSDQPAVDDYLAGRITENQFLRAVNYFRTWGYDYRLYAPIFRFAREQRIPVRALNVAASLTSAVAKAGIAALSEQQRASLPHEIEPADAAYKARLRAAFEEHQALKPDAFDHFVEAQLVWDEGMAANAAAYLSANEGRMVILAGAGHLVFGSGIPKRLERRTHDTYAIVLSSGIEVEPQVADYILLSKKAELPPAGALGASLKDENGECRVSSLVPAGGAAKAGMRKGDVLVSAGGEAVKTVNDARVALWDKKPGDRVRVSVWRGRRRGLEFEVELGAAMKGGARPLP
ncbi:MAG TPA: ChaN family lipoprotein [Bryobacteraceae bacterium]|nr:ChaN family lipoprotein [Bryobacteraceae bacterium]